MLLKKIKCFSRYDKIVFYNVVGAFVIKGFALLLSFFSMPSYIRFFQNDITLGLWFTALSVLNWILTFDLGIGNGLRNHLSEALACNQHEEARKYISAAYVSIGCLCLGAILIFFLVCDYINWNEIFNIKEQIVSTKALTLTIKIVFTGIILQLFFKLISSVLYAMQKSSINNFMSLCTSVVIIVSINILPSGTNDENIICMAVLHSIAIIVPFLIATIVVFSLDGMKEMRPVIKNCSKKHMKSVLSLGGIFFFIQIMYMFIMNTNEYLITYLIGSEYVVEYQIYYRIFNIGSMLFVLATTPIWSAITGAKAQKNMKWIKSIYNKLVLITILGVVCNFIIIPFLQPFVNVWLKENSITINLKYSIIFAIMASTTMLISTLSSVANGLGKLKIQSIFYCIGAVIKIPIAILIVGLTNSWIGVVIANIISVLGYVIVEPMYMKKYLREKAL